MTNIRIPTMSELKRKQYEDHWDLAFKGKRVGWMCEKNENRGHEFDYIDFPGSTVGCIHCGVTLNG